MWLWIETNSVELIGHGLTLIGFVSGALIVAWQLSRQHKSSLELQRSNAKEELKLEIYKTINERIRHLSHANVTAAIYAFMIPFHIENYQKQVAKGIPLAPLKQRADEFARLHAAAHEAQIKLIQEFESWMIAFPEFNLFQTAINSASYDAEHASISLFTQFTKYLPTDPPKDAPANIPRPITKRFLSEAELSELNDLANSYKRSMDEIGTYIVDLQIEAQNRLLSGIFEDRAPQRKPLDPEWKVLSTEPDHVEELMAHFLSETPWGKEKKRQEVAYNESQQDR
jgi:hypothetical protein